MVKNAITFTGSYEVGSSDTFNEIALSIFVSDEFYDDTELSRSENPSDAFSVYVKQVKGDEDVQVYLYNEGFLCEVQLSDKEKEEVLDYIAKNNLHHIAKITLPGNTENQKNKEGFKISKVEEKYDDTCEECGSEEKPVYHLKGKYDNIDAMLCKNCLNQLKIALNQFSL